MQTYTTQMDAARKGIVTPQMETVAKKEYRTVEEIRQLVAEGKVAIPANKHHECLNPELKHIIQHFFRAFWTCIFRNTKITLTNTVLTYITDICHFKI